MSDEPPPEQWVYAVQGETTEERRASLLLGLRLLIADALNRKLDGMLAQTDELLLSLR